MVPLLTTTLTPYPFSPGTSWSRREYMFLSTEEKKDVPAFSSWW